MSITYIKICPCCRKQYTTTSRNQKFCSTECNKKYAAKQKARKKEYEQNKELKRLDSRAHSLSTAVVRQLVAMGLREWKCERCGKVEGLEVHHSDLNPYNATPANLKVLCVKCHNQVHSELEQKLKEEMKTLEDVYVSSVRELLIIK